jgi:integrase
MGRRGGEQEGKSRAAKRTVVLLAELAPILREHLLRTGSRGDDLVFGVSASAPFEPTTVRRRALSAWRAANKRLGEGEVPMRPIGLHECRHTLPSTLIASGTNPKDIQVMMGHATIAMTFDTYGHLFPGGEEDLLAKADAFLARQGERPGLRVVG